jgi:hypothetical protein
MSRREWTLFISDMLEACNKISGYVNGMSFEDFCADMRTVDAVVRNLEIIGEAARGIPEHEKCLRFRDRLGGHQRPAKPHCSRILRSQSLADLGYRS